MMISAVGWGALKYSKSTPPIEDEESIADLDGFESTPVYKKLHQDSETTSESTQNNSRRPTRYQDANFSLSAGVLAAPGVNESEDSANVWFTGTIEEVEPVDRIELPRRLNDDPDHSFHSR
jgi:hypothetical protein